MFSIIVCLKIVKYWPAKGKSGFIVWRYKLKRDDPSPSPWSKAGQKRIKELGLVMQVNIELSYTVKSKKWLERQYLGLH